MISYCYNYPRNGAGYGVYFTNCVKFPQLVNNKEIGLPDQDIMVLSVFEFKTEEDYISAKGEPIKISDRRES